MAVFPSSKRSQRASRINTSCLRRAARLNQDERSRAAECREQSVSRGRMAPASTDDPSRNPSSLPLLTRTQQAHKNFLELVSEAQRQKSSRQACLRLPWTYEISWREALSWTAKKTPSPCLISLSGVQSWRRHASMFLARCMSPSVLLHSALASELCEGTRLYSNVMSTKRHPEFALVCVRACYAGLARVCRYRHVAPLCSFYKHAFCYRIALLYHCAMGFAQKLA